MKKPELTMELHPNGKMFIEIDSLIEWFDFKDENREFNRIGHFAAIALRSMKEKCLSKPNAVMTEDEYYARGEKH